MKAVSASDVLDIALAVTSATLLARRWESALLVNVDNETLQRLMGNPEAMAALMSIDGFRSLNQDIQTIINKSESMKKAKKEGDENLTSKEKKELSEGKEPLLPWKAHSCTFGFPAVKSSSAFRMSSSLVF